jgi:hypothetical protein
MNELIASRALAGIGGGGMQMYTHYIFSDLMSSDPVIIALSVS